jgi:exopolyphosphatase/guanosine-5'-triphosphate,3'-diphosphate pyrophosphatase
VREGWLYAQLPAAERYLDPLVEAPRSSACRSPASPPSGRRWHAGPPPCSRRDRRRRLRIAACALSDIAWRDHPDLRASESFRRLLQFPFIGVEHVERVFLAAAIHARYAGNADDSRLSPAIGLLSDSARRRARILGLAMLLGYRISGAVPDILEGARLVIGTDCVRLEVGAAARVPDSEVVASRLQLLANAAGIGRIEITEVPT